MTPEQEYRSGGLWGCGDLEAFFKGAPQVNVPWPSAGRRKSEPRIPASEVKALVAGSARLHEVDPRTLFATQPWVLRAHTDCYSTGEWEVSGRTSADMHSFANRYPTFVERRGQLIIATGHHRSLVALIEGRPVLARIASSDAQPVAITPHLAIVAIEPPGNELSDGDQVDLLVTRLQQGHRISVADRTAAAEVLLRVGLDQLEIADRMLRAGFDAPG